MRCRPAPPWTPPGPNSIIVTSSASSSTKSSRTGRRNAPSTTGPRARRSSTLSSRRTTSGAGLTCRRPPHEGFEPVTGRRLPRPSLALSSCRRDLHGRQSPMTASFRRWTTRAGARTAQALQRSPRGGGRNRQPRRSRPRLDRRMMLAELAFQCDGRRRPAPQSGLVSAVKLRSRSSRCCCHSPPLRVSTLCSLGSWRSPIFWQTVPQTWLACPSRGVGSRAPSARPVRWRSSCPATSAFTRISATTGQYPPSLRRPAFAALPKQSPNCRTPSRIAEKRSSVWSPAPFMDWMQARGRSSRVQRRPLACSAMSYRKWRPGSNRAERQAQCLRGLQQNGLQRSKGPTNPISTGTPARLSRAGSRYACSGVWSRFSLVGPVLPQARSVALLSVVSLSPWAASGRGLSLLDSTARLRSGD